MKRQRIRESHQASYADPITLCKGAPLALSGREDLWEGHRWLWAVAEDGRAGWVPDDLITVTAEGPVAARDYWATELTCAAGEAVDVLWQTHGWAWCRKSGGGEGWLPLGKLFEERPS